MHMQKLTINLAEEEEEEEEVVLLIENVKLLYPNLHFSTF